MVKLETSLLSVIKEDIQNNINILVEGIELHQSYLISAEIVLNALDYQLPNHDSLEIHSSRMCRISNIALSSASFETLKSEGVRIINNEDLRKLIINLFENRYIMMDDVNLVYTVRNILPPELIKRFGYGFGLAIPNNYDELVHDEEFKNLIYYTMNSRNNILQISLGLLDDSNFVINQIDQQLNQR